MAKSYYIKIKNVKRSHKESKAQYYMYLSRIYKELKINKKKTTQQKNRKTIYVNRYFSEKETQMMNNFENKCSTLFYNQENEMSPH